MPQTQVHSPANYAGMPYGKSPNLSFIIWYGLTVHIIRFLNYKQNFPKFLLSNSSELRQFCAIRPHSPRIPQIPRNSPTQSANYAKFAHFVNLFYIVFQAPAPAENPTEFQRITQIPRNSPTQSANDAKFAPLFTLYITFQMPDQWQGTP